MIIEKLSGGWRITIPETANNSEFVYEMPIVPDGPEHIRKEQQRLARQCAIRGFSMENFFKTLPHDWDEYWKHHKENPFDTWSKVHGMDWNEWFHDEMNMMKEDAWALMREYHLWHFDTYGWTAL